MTHDADPRAEYLRRIARWDTEIAAGERRHQLVANFRLALVAAAGWLVWMVWTGRAVAAWFAAPLAVFIALVIWHDRILQRIERSKRARRIYERGVERLDGTWVGKGADGARFSDTAVFAPDLDLFGSGSLFQLLNTVRTEVGEDVLAEWLIHGADPAEISARQQAVDELRPMVDFREALAVTAADGRIGKTSALAKWALHPESPSVLAISGFVVLSLISVSLLVTVFTASLPVRGLFLLFFFQLGAATLWARRGGAAYAGVEEAGSDLALLKTLLARLESQSFLSPRLVALRDNLPEEGALASRRIASLERLVTTLQSCANPMVSPFAIFFQVPTLTLMAIARWRAKHGHAIAGWLRAVGEAEAFASLATFAFENPDSPFPVIEPSGPVFDAEALAHPLLHRAIAVPNDVRLGRLPSEAAPPGALSAGGPHVLMISGSNMSGKSTLLRAVGVNVVLALAGAPVRASKLRLSPVALGVSIRIEDSLQGGQSRFYAEILRLRSIVDLAKGPVPLLFLLDEMLAGTNSFDRRIGAEAIIKSLAAIGAIGLVTTHDLALTELVPALGVAADNVHFEDRIEDGKMAFDYRMRPGVVQRSNALALMRAIGLDV
jgi:hypothetical protein